MDGEGTPPSLHPCWLRGAQKGFKKLTVASRAQCGLAWELFLPGILGKASMDALLTARGRAQQAAKASLSKASLGPRAWQGRVQEQVGGAGASPQSTGRALQPAAAWSGTELPSLISAHRSWSPVPREAVSHPSRLTASLIQCSLAPAPAETTEGSPPSPAREADAGLRHCPSLDAPFDLPGSTTTVSSELVRCRDPLPRVVPASSPPPAPFSKA